MVAQVIASEYNTEDWNNKFVVYLSQLNPRIAILKKDLLDDIIGNESEM